ncbi:MAG: prolipoprotein diacylglyceryl transferase [Corallococcus sp.]|nr:prolipoprotein diacylglyceryl transferase [Corallococcus sp.]MCM1359373.1 prolipoprotein diacylglyceryl transferase [Corallococcus sp.]MCM1394816.1 prolipoprotein diacylglyceryl transferase [Corallococcus sp.]
MVRSFQIFGITFYPYSLLMVAGAVVCFLTYMYLSYTRHKEAKNENIFVVEMVVVSLGAALPAAMLVDSLFKYFETGVFKFGAATYYGGMLFAVAVFSVILCCKKRKQISLYERLSDLAPCIAIGHFFGRIGCFLGGCCFGAPTDSCLGVVFPKGSIPYEYYGGAVKIHPTQLYEAAYLLALFFLLFFAFKKDAFPMYFILYGVGRTFIEFFRNDDRGSLYALPLSPSQFISLVLIVVGGVVLALHRRNKAVSVS